MEAQSGHMKIVEDMENQSSPQNRTPWEMIDDIDLEEEFQHRFQVLQGCAAHLKGRFRQAARVALEARHNAVHNNDHTMEARAWKLFLLLPFMLLRKERGVGKVGKDELSRRFDKFSEGQWRTLLEEARRAVQVDCPRVATSMTPERRAQAACQKVRLGKVSRARQCLTGAALAPGNEDTFRALQGMRPQQVVRPLTQDVLEFEPEVPVELDRATFLTSLKSAPRGSSLGPGGCTCEHLKVLLDECDTMELLLVACSSVAQARILAEVSPALMSARLTALAKPDGGVRGIATGSSVRRLVGRTLAKQFTKLFEAECAPFQYVFIHESGD